MSTLQFFEQELYARRPFYFLPLVLKNTMIMRRQWSAVRLKYLDRLENNREKETQMKQKRCEKYKRCKRRRSKSKSPRLHYFLNSTSPLFSPRQAKLNEFPRFTRSH